MTISPAVLAVLAELRAFAADPGSIFYVFNPPGKKAVLVFVDQINARATDELLYAYLIERIAGRLGIDDP